MTDPVIRRQITPRLHVTIPLSANLPRFLIEGASVPMAPAPVTGPHDALEQAIIEGAVWDQGADPVEIEAFDADEEVISVILEESDDTLELDVKTGRDGVQILANGRPMAQVAGAAGVFARSNLRVVKARAGL